MPGERARGVGLTVRELDDLGPGVGSLLQSVSSDSGIHGAEKPEGLSTARSSFCQGRRGILDWPWGFRRSRAHPGCPDPAERTVHGRTGGCREQSVLNRSRRVVGL